MEVFRMKMRGLNNSVIARELDVNRNTILRDSQWVKDHQRELAVGADKNTEVGQAMAKLEEIEKDAMYQFSETTNPHAKNNFLLTAISACEKRMKIMMESGIIDKATEKVNLTVDYAKMTTEELIEERNKALERLKGLGASVGNQN
jgi:predicted nucleotidyltransferase